MLLADQLKEDLNELSNRNSEIVKQIQELVSTKYELLEKLCDITRQNSDTKVARKKIADAVTKLIDDLSIRSEKIIQMENKINQTEQNLIADFKNDLPELKEADYRLFLFSICKFSTPMISLFLKEEKTEAVYNRKKRLKDKIKRLDSPNSERYLKYL